MKEDPRFRNERFDTSSIGAFLEDYAGRLGASLAAVDKEALDAARALVEQAAAGGHRIYSVGNGGSAAIADHLCCDWIKGTHVEGHPTIDSYSMTSNAALYSAIANDFGFEEVFEIQVGLLGKEGDVLIAISSSGNSPNIIRAVEAAKAKGMATVGLSGFSGGKLKDCTDVSLHVDASNYGVVEDAHQALMHVIAQFIVRKREG